MMQTPAFSLVPQSAGLEELITKAMQLAEASQTESTRRAMKSCWKDVESWCDRHGFPSLTVTPSPEVVALYLADRATSLSPQTLVKRLTSITQALRANGVEGLSPASTKQPIVGNVLRGIRRTKGVSPGANQKQPLLTSQIRQLVETCGDDLQGLRDRSLILTAFAAGGLRRANVAAICVESLEFCDAGMIHHQGRSKTDQEGIGRIVGIPFGSNPSTCPVTAMRRWLTAAQIESGPVFRAVRLRGGKQLVDDHALNPASVNYIVKRAARRAGLDEDLFGAHSLRSGFCSQASLHVSDRLIAKQSGHKGTKSLDRYVRLAGAFRENAAESLGL
jgi:integrase